jgi:hypothetical protein
MTLRLVLTACILGFTARLACSEETVPAPPVELNDLERAFVDQMSGVMMEGSFSLDSRKGASPGTERYEIQSVQKVKDHNWIVTARIVYGKLDLPLPVPVQVYWADKTPVLQVTNLTLPGLGQGFTARILFQDQRYAGTWQHGKIGGQMWGTLVRPAVTDGGSPQPSVEKSPSAP